MNKHMSELQDIQNRLDFVVAEVCRLNGNVYAMEKELVQYEREREGLEIRKFDLMSKIKPEDVNG